MDIPTWERKVAKLPARSWHEVRDAWLEHIPEIQNPGTAPQDALGDLPTVQAAVQEAKNDEPKSFDSEILGLRNGVLAEALFILHKSANVLGSAQVHIDRGLCSWSLSSAYHAAFFGMKAILQLLGIVVIETGNQTYLVDIWSPPKKKRKNILGLIPSKKTAPVLSWKTAPVGAAGMACRTLRARVAPLGARVNARSNGRPDVVA